jgi:hypothetical protein
MLVSINEYMKAKELMKEGASTKTKPSFACSDPDCRQSESTVTNTGKVSMARKKTHYFCYTCSNLQGNHKHLFLLSCSII